MIAPRRVIQMDANQSQGLMWKKIDLHIHTPASKEDRVDKSVRAADIIRRAKELKLDAICVSDHNTGDWIDKVKLAARKTGITVFPGVEITAQGGERNVHVLGVFDPSKGTSYVNDLLAKLDIVDDKRGRTDILAKGSVNQVLDTISEMGGVPLLAHADSQSGVLKEIKGMQAFLFRCSMTSRW
jgi:PHP family Zn ribbon phosphoesterase